MTIERSSDMRTIRVTHKGLLDKVVAANPPKAGDRQRYHTPADDSLFDVNIAQGVTALDASEKTEFLSILMTLMYMARLTRPDILMPVTQLATRTHCATTRDRDHLFRIVRYLENTRELGIFIHCTKLQFIVSCDASYGTHTPKSNTKGHTGYIIYLGEDNGTDLSYVHARSGKQKVASTSSTDAEVIGVVEATKMVKQMRDTLAEMGVSDLCEIIIHQDNESVIKMSTEETSMKRSKHLLTKLTYIADQVRDQIVKIVYVCTADMVADVLTKPLFGGIFYKRISKMLGLFRRTKM